MLLVADALFATDTFFWIQSELPQGLALMCLLFALAESPRLPAAVTWPAILVVAPVVAFMHPLLLFPVVFWAGYLLLQSRARGVRFRHLALIGFYVASVAVKTFFFKTTYDTGAFGGLKNFARYFPDYLHLYANKRLLLRVDESYLLLPVAAGAVVWWAARRRAWQRLVFTAAFLLAYGLLINVSYPGADVQAFYIENMYLPLGIMLGVPLVYDVLPGGPSGRWPLVILVAMLLFALARFVAVSRPFSQRVKWMQALVEKAGNKKIIIPAAAAPMPLLKMEWGTGYEAWLLSTSEQNRSASVIIAADTAALSPWAGGTRQFLGPWGPTNYADLPRRYFNFPDTTAPYHVARREDLPPSP